MIVPLLVLLAAAPAAPSDCDALYFGEERPRDLPGALACYRAHKDWKMVTVLVLNGEGAPADLKAAREAFRMMLGDQGGQLDADAEALEQLLQRREARPQGGARIDFCRDVAQTTLSMNACQARDDRAEARRVRETIGKLRDAMPPGQQRLLDEVTASVGRVIEADGQRLYQQYAEGSIRNIAALSQQRAVRRDFTARVDVWLVRRSTPAAKRPLQEADRELNAAYKEVMASEDPEYRSKASEAQRAWLRYRDAFARLMRAVQPTSPDVERVVRSQLTEDRITELKTDPVAPDGK